MLSVECLVLSDRKEQRKFLTQDSALRTHDSALKATEGAT
ncbi:MAG: hypothetical protein OJF51_001490 [Nitrospira sp.]|nr:MAG: hypothetical protein OJF51_001490 [Nitrospira sp.]